MFTSRSADSVAARALRRTLVTNPSGRFAVYMSCQRRRCSLGVKKRQYGPLRSAGRSIIVARSFGRRIRNSSWPTLHRDLGHRRPLYCRWPDLPPQSGVREVRVAAPPETDAAMAALSRFAAAAADRYADYPDAWEIRKEPDSPIFWPPKPRPEALHVSSAKHATGSRRQRHNQKCSHQPPRRFRSAFPAFIRCLWLLTLRSASTIKHTQLPLRMGAAAGPGECGR